ncbi:MAG: VOC family protein [Bacteroidota bacterium]|nr:VOC family protein [Bacteroidota bacterium]
MTTYAPGNFCWMELATSDQKAAKDFYSKVFGWTTDDQPMGPDQFYTMLNVGGKSVGALYGMDKAQLDRKVPPHWNVYISVASADAATAKAISLGGKALMEPFDVMDVGRMSIVEDPTGAMFCIWEARNHKGAQLVGETGSFCWWELNTRDTAKAKAFYTTLFGWTVGGDANYTEWKNGDQSIGGMMEIQAEWGPVPPNWLAYIMVPNCDETVSKIKEAGGSVMMDAMDIPDMGRFAVVADPQHAVFAVFQRNAK